MFLQLSHQHATWIPFSTHRATSWLQLRHISTLPDTYLVAQWKGKCLVVWTIFDKKKSFFAEKSNREFVVRCFGVRTCLEMLPNRRPCLSKGQIDSPFFRSESTCRTPILPTTFCSSARTIVYVYIYIYICVYIYIYIHYRPRSRNFKKMNGVRAWHFFAMWNLFGIFNDSPSPTSLGLFGDVSPPNTRRGIFLVRGLAGKIWGPGCSDAQISLKYRNEIKKNLPRGGNAGGRVAVASPPSPLSFTTPLPHP
jgi:hypothetical protein